MDWADYVFKSTVNSLQRTRKTQKRTINVLFVNQPNLYYLNITYVLLAVFAIASGEFAFRENCVVKC